MISIKQLNILAEKEKTLLSVDSLPYCPDFATIYEKVDFLKTNNYKIA